MKEKVKTMISLVRHSCGNELDAIIDYIHTQQRVLHCMGRLDTSTTDLTEIRNARDKAELKLLKEKDNE